MWLNFNAGRLRGCYKILYLTQFFQAYVFFTISFIELAELIFGFLRDRRISYSTAL